MGINLSSKVVGTVGRFDEQKGHMFFLKAIPKILQDVPDVRFIFVGDGSLRSKLEKMGRELEVNQNIIFTGVRRDIPEILSIMDVFVLPSIFEGFGIVLLEAMAVGKPVVASRAGGIPEIVEHGLTGILIEPANPSAIAGSVVKLLKNPVEAKRIANAGRAEVERKFTADAMARKIEGVYDEVSGFLAIHRQSERGYYRSQIYPHTRYDHILALLVRLSDMGIEIIHSPNFGCSMVVVRTIYNQRTKPEEEHSLFKKIRPIRIPVKLSANPAVPKLMALCPRLPEKSAIRLINKFGSIWSILNTSDNELLEVTGFGKGLLDKLKKGVGKE